MAKTINDIPLNDRPYEKLEQLGRSNLTNSELLAIILRNGTKSLNCIEIAQNILRENDKNLEMTDLEYLSKLSIEELCGFEGIGIVKAKQIHAVVELSKRISNFELTKKSTVKCPKDLYDILISGFAGRKQECLKTVILNKQNKIISIVTNFIGKSDEINIGLKEIFSEPLKQVASGIILAHNHPSGNLYPSKSDIHFTSKVLEYAKMFELELLDHVIISDNGYMSMKDSGYI